MGKKRQRWVIKAGSNMVCSGGPLLLRAWMEQIAVLKKKHHVDVIWVTSGAIATAVERVGGTSAIRKKGKRRLDEKQALSAIGQPLVMELYLMAMQACDLRGAQILLTYDDLAHSARRKNFQNTVNKLLEWGVIPVLNENDAVATEEIQFGDNDSLSAKVAHFSGADRLVILTDVQGLFDSDPRKNPGARLIRDLDGVPSRYLAQVGKGAGSSRGTGGMYSKLQAAAQATRNGVETRLAKGDVSDILIRIASDEEVGTRIRKAKKASSSKKRRNRRAK